jgi:hypothetical protein
MSKRLTIKQQEAIAAAAKNRKGTESIPAAAESTPSVTETITEDTSSVETNSEDCIRNKQVNVKFTADDLSRLKKAAGNSHRPVANYIYHTVMDRISSEGY